MCTVIECMLLRCWREKGWPVGACGQIHFQQCRKYILGKSHFRLSESRAPCTGQWNGLQLLGKAGEGISASPLFPFALQGKEILKKQEKFYLADAALRYSALAIMLTAWHPVLRMLCTWRWEYDCLLEIHDNYPKYVLMMDELSGGNYEGIKTMHIADFLLSSEC